MTGVPQSSLEHTVCHTSSVSSGKPYLSLVYPYLPPYLPNLPLIYP